MPFQSMFARVACRALRPRSHRLSMVPSRMNRFEVLRRWFVRNVGYARLICLALLFGVAGLRIVDPAPIRELRVRTFDTFQAIDPRVKKERPVTIVDIDEKSLASPKLGQWPWPRTRIA